MSRRAKGEPPPEHDPNRLKCTECNRPIKGNDPVRFRPGHYLMHTVCWIRAKRENRLP